ncbi:MAG TPA: cbb3-type cytochrome oxidase assembly protein CcoS [Caldithrix abyssi]|uniref:Cbb3-type cytochrome oxidase assembly protein CcoS n=1 Tax=Caldithrix abyssi TaxID=187145 RepID=A0A7V5VF27_CALAY|nr:cbb3-type cytochrome oxidase assembly protein CcoS [Caldithrix abyssi]
MEVIFILIAFSFLVALGFLWAFIRSVKQGQFDDPVTPAMRMLFDDAEKKTEKKTRTNHTKKEE